MGDNAYARHHDPSIPKDPNEMDGRDVARVILTMPPYLRPDEAICHSTSQDRSLEQADILKSGDVFAHAALFKDAYSMTFSK